MEGPVVSSHPLPREWDEDPLDRERILAWHDHEMWGGVEHPVLWYDIRRNGIATTEPCIWCGRRHTHGDLEGSRVPHCGEHTHDLTRSGNRRSPFARGATRCRVHHRDYIIRRRPL